MSAVNEIEVVVGSDGSLTVPAHELATATAPTHAWWPPAVVGAEA